MVCQSGIFWEMRLTALLLNWTILVLPTRVLFSQFVLESYTFNIEKKENFDFDSLALIFKEFSVMFRTWVWIQGFSSPWKQKIKFKDFQGPPEPWRVWACVFVSHLHSHLEICEARTKVSVRRAQEKGNFQFFASASALTYIHTYYYCSCVFVYASICVYPCVCVASLSTL